jgi:hypothetical protein
MSNYDRLIRRRGHRVTPVSLGELSATVSRLGEDEGGVSKHRYVLNQGETSNLFTGRHKGSRNVSQTEAERNLIIRRRSFSLLVPQRLCYVNPFPK